MHVIRIPGWRALVRELVPFYKRRVGYLVILCLVLSLVAMLPLILTFYGFAVFTFGMPDTHPVNPLFGLLGPAALVWFAFAMTAYHVATVRASFEESDVPMLKLIRGSFDLLLAVRVFGATMLYGLLTLLGFVLFIFPGVYVVIRGSYLSYALIHENLGVMDAFKRSWAMTRGYWWVTALRFGWLFVASAAGSAVITVIGVLIPSPALGAVTSLLLESVWQIAVVIPFILLFSRRMYEVVRDAKHKDSEAFHPLSSGEKWQVAAVVLFMVAIMGVEYAATPKDVENDDGEGEFSELLQEMNYP
jgi:hypothetical protein